MESAKRGITLKDTHTGNMSDSLTYLSIVSGVLVFLMVAIITVT